MTYIDPWGGYNEGMRGLGQTFDTLSAGKRQEEINRMAKAEFDAKMQDRAREQETRKGLASIYDLSKETTTQPEQSPAELMDAPGYDLGKGIPSALPAAQVPKYSQAEIQAKAADFLTTRGDWAALQGLERSMDVSSKIDERSQKMLSNIFKTTKEMRASGFDNDAIKNALKAQADNLNRMSGRQIFDPKMIDTMNVNAAGDLITQDIGGGQKAIMITQPNGTVTVQVVDTTKQQRVENTGRQLDISEERIKQGWSRLNPRLQAELEASKAAGKEESKALIKGKDDYYNAQDANASLLEAETLLNKDPNNVAGVAAKFRGFIGSIDPALETALDSGDRKTFERIMMNNADTFKKLLGPQISNADATLMFKLAGATSSSPAEIRAAIKMLRRRNDTTINTFEKRQGSVGKEAPATKPYSQTGRGAPMTRETIGAIVKTEAVNMKAGTSRKADFNGRKGTITKDAQGNVTVRLD